jgi:hypothetical protein
VSAQLAVSPTSEEKALWNSEYRPAMWLQLRHRVLNKQPCAVRCGNGEMPIMRSIAARFGTNGWLGQHYIEALPAGAAWPLALQAIAEDEARAFDAQ